MDAQPAQAAQPVEPRLHKPGVAGSSPAAAIGLPPGFPTPRDGVDIRFGEPNADYHSDQIPSKSSIADFDVGGPLLYESRHVLRTQPPPQSAALSFGTLLHQWAEIGPTEFWLRVVPVPPEYVTAGGSFSKKGEEWRQSLPPEAIPLTDVDRAKLEAQTNQLLRNSMAREILESTIAGEFSVRFRMNGHQIRCRPDIATKTLWADLKTTIEVKPKETFFQSVRKYRYAMQSAIYEAGAQACGWPEFRLVYIVTSTTFPYACHCVTLPDPLVAKARIRVLQILDEIAERKALDHWLPDDYGTVTELFCPEYAWRD